MPSHTPTRPVPASAHPASATALDVVAHSAFSAGQERLTAENSVLILIDYLDGLAPAVKTLDQATLRNNTAALTKIGRIFGLPTVVLGDTGSFRGQFMPELRETLGDTQPVARTTPSAWDTPAFVDAVRATGRKKLVMAGISTDNCLALTALGALRDGYEVYVVTDASGTGTALAETSALMRLTQAGAVPVGWVALASELMGDWEGPKGTAVGALYRDHLEPAGSGGGGGPAR